MFATIKAWLWVAPYVVIALLVAAVFVYRYQSAEAVAHNQILQTQLDSVVATNAQQQQTIVAMAELAKAKDEIVSTLADNVAAINKSVIDTNSQFSALVTSDPDAKTFVDRPIPDSVKRLHNKPETPRY
jgi:LysB family phage lysis regulatory protein